MNAVISALPDGRSITARSVFGRIFGVSMSLALIAVLASAPTWIGIFRTNPLLFRGSLVIVPSSLPFILLGDYLALRWTFEPIRRGLIALESNRASPGLLEQALTRALVFPLLNFLRIVTVHFLAALIPGILLSGPIMRWMALNTAPPSPMVLVFVIGIASLTHAMLEYFPATRLIEPVIPYLARHLDNQPGAVEKRIRVVGIQTQLLVIMIAATLIPLAVIAMNVLFRYVLPVSPDVAPQTTALMRAVLGQVGGAVVYTLIFTTAIALLLSRHLRKLTHRLLAGMTAVQGGDLEQSLKVTTTDEFADLYAGFNDMVEGLRERERLHDAFGRYVSPELAEQIRSQGVQMTGQALEASVMFVDIRDYTALSGGLAAGEVVALLNAYFARIEPILKAEGGWINKFLGDGFMAVFGAPVPEPDHAARAVRAALAIRAETERFNGEQDGPALRIGIGVASGEMVAGSIGSPDRIEYTVIGDAVNLASRIEALNKEFKTTILISERVQQAARLDGNAAAMPPAQVKGVEGPVTVYAI